jgi:hypothetical protein
VLAAVAIRPESKEVNAIEEPRKVKMNGLRVYVDPVSTELRGENCVFYSRRADGPYYCWRYEEGAGRWRGSRVDLSDMHCKAFCLASWKTVPTALQARLNEHYLE